MTLSTKRPVDETTQIHDIYVSMKWPCRWKVPQPTKHGHLRMVDPRAAWLIMSNHIGHVFKNCRAAEWNRHTLHFVVHRSTCGSKSMVQQSVTLSSILCSKLLFVFLFNCSHLQLSNVISLHSMHVQWISWRFQLVGSELLFQHVTKFHVGWEVLERLYPHI